MMTEHRTTLAMLDGIDRFVDGVGKELMGDFRELPDFWEKRHRVELVAELQLFSRMMLLERCDVLPPKLRTADVEAKIARQREIVKSAKVMREQRESAFGYQGLPDTLESIGWTKAPDEWGPAPWELIDDSGRPFISRFDDFGVIASVADLWAEGVTPADVPEEYREAMRKAICHPSTRTATCGASGWRSSSTAGRAQPTQPNGSVCSAWFRGANDER